jgi:allophanate hydrolase
MDTMITLAVVGLHLRGEPRNGELLERGGTFLRAARTAAAYRLYRLPSGVPGLVRRDPGARIEIELWELTERGAGSLLGRVRRPLALGRVELEDGTDVTGFLCEAYATDGAEDITAGGGWRHYRNSSKEGTSA